MTQAMVYVVLFVLVLALLPFAVKWLQQRSGGGGATGALPGSRVVSAVAVGPHQRVVTVEVGPEGARTQLVLGVTAQTITCLHVVAPGPELATNTPKVQQSPALVDSS
jgi:flagellar protein FliO/FliZ